ncbi:MAG: PH domain-containing protein [Bdellovibrionota bacterium]
MENSVNTDIDRSYTDLTDFPEGDLVIYRHFLSLAPMIILFVIASLVAFYYSASDRRFIQEVDIYGVIFSLPLLGLIPLVLAAYIIHGLYNSKYVIRDHCLICVEGLLSFKMQETRVEYEHVRGIEVQRSLYQRLFGLGDIKIGSAMQGDVEIYIRGIINPRYYEKVIEYRLRKHVVQSAEIDSDKSLKGN